jgi:hypothetical protein
MLFNTLKVLTKSGDEARGHCKSIIHVLSAQSRQERTLWKEDNVGNHSPTGKEPFSN